MILFQKIFLASDHAGVQLKQCLVDYLQGLSVPLEDLGPHETTSVDYPDYAHLAVTHVLKTPQTAAVLICGTGIGMSIAANRHQGIRAAVGNQGVTEARLSRAHNNANVLCLGARLMGPQLALETLQAFLEIPFEGGRHEGRLAKLDTLI